MRHPETLFLVDNEQSEIVKRHILLQELMRADKQIDAPRARRGKDAPRLFRRREARKRLNAHGVILEASAGGGVMLLRQHGRRHEYRRLFAVQYALHDGA